jgi:trk system potassium uptake protein TrkA
LVVHGDQKSSKVVGRRIEELPKIGGARIAVIVRKGEPQVIYKEGLPVTTNGERVIIARHNTVIEAEDHVVVFCTRKREVQQVEKLFQVGFHFF